MTNLPQPRPTGSLLRDQRVGYADRERACDLLAESYGEGRLSHEEFEHRTELAMQAQTSRQLAVLLADLPGASLARPTGVAIGWILLEAVAGIGFLLGAALLFALAMVALVAGSGGWWIVLLFSLLSAAAGAGGVGLAVHHTRQRRG